MKTNWPIKKLGEVLDVLTGFAFKSSLFGEQEGAPLIRIRDLKNGFTKTKYKGAYDPKFIVKNRDILIGMDGEFKCYKWNGGEALLNQRVCKLINFRGIMSDFLYYGINKYLKNIEERTTYVTVKHISPESIKAIMFPVPGIEEQKRIVKKLEKILGKIEETCNIRQESIEEASVVIIKKLEKIFSQYSKYKVQKVQNIAEVGTGATPLRGKSNYYGGTIPWVTSGSTNKPFITEANEYITELALKETNCKINKKHTLVVAMYGEGKTRGQVSELLIDAATNQACATISVNRDIVNQKFVKYFFELNYKKTRELSRGGPQSNLNLTRIKNIKLPVPEIKEQEKIVGYLDGLSEKVQALKKLQQEQLQDLEALKQSVLHQAFEGNLI